MERSRGLCVTMIVSHPCHVVEPGCCVASSMIDDTLSIGRGGDAKSTMINKVECTESVKESAPSGLTVRKSP